MGPPEMQQFCELDEAGQNLMRTAVQQMKLRICSYHRVLKLARAIVNLLRRQSFYPHI